MSTEAQIAQREKAIIKANDCRVEMARLKAEIRRPVSRLESAKIAAKFLESPGKGDRSRIRVASLLNSINGVGDRKMKSLTSSAKIVGNPHVGDLTAGQRYRLAGALRYTFEAYR